jgi:hypothetical protein
VKRLWRFYWDCGRQGDVESVFVATDEEVEEAIGKRIYFGEILGKHSEVHGTLERSDLTRLDVSNEAIEEVTKILGETWSGYNPLRYVRDEEDEEEDE